MTILNTACYPQLAETPKFTGLGNQGESQMQFIQTKKPYTISLVYQIIKYMKITTVVMLNYCFLDTKSLKGWCKSMRL